MLTKSNWVEINAPALLTSDASPITSIPSNSNAAPNASRERHSGRSGRVKPAGWRVLFWSKGSSSRRSHSLWWCAALPTRDRREWRPARPVRRRSGDARRLGADGQWRRQRSSQRCWGTQVTESTLCEPKRSWRALRRLNGWPTTHTRPSGASFYLYFLFVATARCVVIEIHRRRLIVDAMGIRGRPGWGQVLIVNGAKWKHGGLVAQK